MDVFRDELVHFKNMGERVEANSLVWELRFKWKCSLNEMYVLEYSALETSTLAQIWSKSVKKKQEWYCIFYIDIAVRIENTILNIQLDTWFLLRHK